MISRISKGVKYFWAKVALLSVEMLIILAIFVTSLISFIFITRRIFYLKNERFDHDVFTALHGIVSERNNDIMLFITALGNHMVLIPANILLIIWFLFIRKN